MGFTKTAGDQILGSLILNTTVAFVFSIVVILDPEILIKYHVAEFNCCLGCNFISIMIKFLFAYKLSV